MHELYTTEQHGVNVYYLVTDNNVPFPLGRCFAVLGLIPILVLLLMSPATLTCHTTTRRLKTRRTQHTPKNLPQSHQLGEETIHVFSSAMSPSPITPW